MGKKEVNWEWNLGCTTEYKLSKPYQVFFCVSSKSPDYFPETAEGGPEGNWKELILLDPPEASFATLISQTHARLSIICH